jgi:hypothetical protein
MLIRRKDRSATFGGGLTMTLFMFILKAMGFRFVTEIELNMRNFDD